MDMSMGSTSMNTPLNDSGVDFSNYTQALNFLAEVLDDTELQVVANSYARAFWYGVCAIIAICAFFNFAQRSTFRMRLRAAAANKLRPAAPSNIFTNTIATITAVAREVTYLQLTPIHSRLIKIPPVGRVISIVGHLAWVLLLVFVNNNIEGGQHYTSLGIRAAWLAIAQVPLLILLAGKNNLIGAITGVSYERLNVLHRWTSRILLLLATLHMLFINMSFHGNGYDIAPIEYATDSCIPTGFSVFSVLIWMNISTIAPIRNWSYEFFVVQHILTFFGFVVAIMMHLPSTAYYTRVYIIIPIALYVVDRAIRSTRYAWNNIRPGNATLMSLPGGVTKITVRSKAIKSWAPGSHVLLSIPKFGVGQSHPATIASTPTSHDGDLVFMLKAHKGFTYRLLNSSSTLSLSSTKSSIAPASTSTHVALIDGPYGSSHADFACFDSILLIAGSTGVTFTLPLLLDIAHRFSFQRLPVKRITFLWIVKNTTWTSWIASELNAVARKLAGAGVELDVRVHVTCDDEFTTGFDDEKSERDCQTCDKSLGPCCCAVDEDETVTRVPSQKSSKATGTKLQTISSASSTSSITKSRILPSATFHSGRPDINSLLWDNLERAEGETGVAVCGPLGLQKDVRNYVVECSNERAVHKGTGAMGIYLHAEGFGW